MEFFFPDDNLDRRPPEQTRITSLRAESYPDGTRVRVDLEITPFQKRPHLEVSLTNSEGAVVASTSIVEPLGWKLELTLHIRGELRNPYILEARLYYPDGPHAQPESYTFEVQPSESTE